MTLRNALSVLLAFGTLGALFAAPPADPQLITQAYVNGALNVGIWWYEGKYPDYTGPLKSAGLSYDVQMKGPGETEWSDVSGGWDTFDKNNDVFRCWYCRTNFVGSATLRVRARNAAGETSGWVETDPLTATVNVKGTAIYGASCNGNAFDGRIGTWIDGTGNGGNDMWSGYLFDAPTRIKGIRYLARLDHRKLAGRYQNSLFQIASDASFSDATTVHAVAANYMDITRMTEVYFDEPVTCRAIRHWKEFDSYEQSAEVEYIPADPPFRPVLDVSPSDVTNFYPVITWTLPADAGCTSCRLERSFHSDGPFTPLTDDLDPATDTLACMDEGAYVGVTAYYRVTGVCSHPTFEGRTMTSAVTPYTRARRLDRAWGAETVLLDGATVLPGTNGVMKTGLHDHNLCFDGNTATFVDEHQDAAFYPPIGLKFAQRAWVCGFGYICRNDNTCYYRVRNARLYAADDYPGLTDRVPVSVNAVQASQDTRFYYQACTEVPAGGAFCYFLYGGSDFFGNVAELMLFGWTEADTANAPVVVAPKQLAFTHRGAELDVAWTGAANASRYTLERRARGTETWTVVAVDTAATSFTETGLETGYYEYRVTAAGDLGTAVSDVFVYPFYQPADGTGLPGVVMWPFDSTETDPRQLAHETVLAPGTVDLHLAAADELAPGVTGPARLAWEGEVVAPFTGSYTFSLETDAGGAVFIDHVSVANSWTGGTKAPAGSINLTAGSHAIRVDYRVNEDNQARKCVLRWGGVVADEVIPASQLKPAGTAPSAQIDGFTSHVFGSSRCSHVERRGEGRYLVTGGDLDLGTKDALNLSTLLKPWSGSFDCEMYVSPGNAYGKCAIVVMSDAGDYLCPAINTAGARDSYGLVGYDAATGWQKSIHPWTLYSEDNQPQCWLRLTRLGQTFTMYWRKAESDAWTEVATWTDADRMFGRDVHLGMGVWCHGAGNNPVQFQVSRFAVKAMPGGTVLLFR
ncbi:MAG: PA14 domain-containing protein [Kiritimatiellae bacterium]|nr:PA14 domain-containing protein [Kiritimatiellia bacterium]